MAIDRLTLTGVFVCTLAYSTAYGMLLVLPLYLRQDLHGTEADYGVLTASGTITAIACLALLIRFPDRIAPNRLLAGSALGYAIGSFGIAQLHSFGPGMVAFGLLLGTSWAVAYTTAPMVVSALSDDTSRAKYVGYATGMIQVGFGFGPVLVSVLRIGYPNCFRIAGALSLLAAVVAALLSVRSPTLTARTGSDQPFFGSLLGVLRSPSVVPLGIILLCACIFTTMNGFQTTFADSRGLSYGVFYVTYTIAVIAARFVIAPLLRNASSAGVIACGTAGVTVSMLVFLVVHQNVVYGIAAALLGVTYGLTLPGVQARAVNVSPEALRARILPLAGLVFQTGILLFPLVAGNVIARFGYTTTLVVLVCVAAVIAAFGLGQWIRTRQLATRADQNGSH